MTRASTGLFFICSVVLSIGGCTRPSEGRSRPAPDAAGEDASEVATSDATLDAESSALLDAAIADAGGLSRVRSVLEIGDSMVGYASGLAKVLRARFTAEGIEFHSDAVTSASITSFDQSDKLERLMKLFHPDLVILNLGTNQVSVPKPESLAPHVASLVKKIMPRRCLWLGPPSLHEKPPATPSPLVAVLRDATPPCTFFDSSALVLERQPDKIHPTERGAMVWARAFTPVLEPLLGK